MSKYTTELRYICESIYGSEHSQGQNKVEDIIAFVNPKIFDFFYPIFDDSYKTTLQSKIIRHYYTREISEETVGLWKLRLSDYMNRIMPYYNQLYESALLKFNPFYDVDLTTEHSGDGVEQRDFNSVSESKENISEGLTDFRNRNTQNTGSSETTDKSVKQGDSSRGETEQSVNSSVEKADKIGDSSNKENENKSSSTNETRSKQGDNSGNETDNREGSERNYRETASNETSNTTNDGKKSEDGNEISDIMVTTEKMSGTEGLELSTDDNTNDKYETNIYTTDDTKFSTDDNWDLQSDTPQGGLTNIGGGWPDRWANIENSPSLNGEVGYLSKAERKHDRTASQENLDRRTQITDTEQISNNRSVETNVLSDEGVSDSKVASREYEKGFSDKNESSGEIFKDEIDDNTTQTESTAQKTTAGKFSEDETMSGTGTARADKTSLNAFSESSGKNVDNKGKIEKRGYDGFSEAESRNIIGSDKIEQSTKELGGYNKEYDGVKGVKEKNIGNIKNTDQYVNHVFGKTAGKSYSKLLMEFRETFLNIDQMIIDELKPLFFLLW